VVVSNKNIFNVDTGPSYVEIKDNNSISGYARGIDVINLMPSSPLPVSVTIRNNDIFGNTRYGVMNNTGNWVTATENWWGFCTGPYHPTLNPSGQGNAVSDLVAFNPWETLPDPAGPITGPPVLYLGQTGIAFSIEPVPHVSSYTWTLPPGVSIAWGAGTNSIRVDVSAVAVSGSISVNGVNPCGNGSATSEYITVLSLPATLPLNNITVSDGQTSCYSALQTITVGGAPGPYTIKPGGSATMIAGTNIRLLYGTTVEPGGYLHGFITTNNTWCGQQSDAPVVSGVTPEEDPMAAVSGAGFFKVYPNPTHGRFTVELSEGEESADAVVRVYGLMGKLILEKPMDGLSKNELSLLDNPSGIYIIKVQKNDKVGTVKIIRQQ
jgi:hypothetical protein